MISRLRILAHGGLLSSIVALYAIHIANYLFPLMTVPYLTRILGPAGWGLVAFTQSFGAYLALIVEYGFNLSATREVARFRDSLERRSELLAGVFGAKVVLASIVLALVMAVRYWIPLFRASPELLWAGVFATLATAFNVVWYFQGLERMRLLATLDVIAKSLVLINTFLWVKGPGDAWIALVLPGVGSVLSTLAGLALAYREVPRRLPSWTGTWEALRMGWPSFLFRSAVSLYTIGNVFLLGILVGPENVSYYAGAEKISKALLGLLGPLSHSLYPRLNYLVQHSREEAARLARISLIAMGLGGIFVGAGVFVLAPALVRILLGDGYEPAVPVLRILSLLLPLVALSNVLGIQWMLPLGLDRAMNVIIFSAGLLNLTLAVLLAPRFGHFGMALSVVSSEAFVTLSMYHFLRRRCLDPLGFWAREHE